MSSLYNAQPTDIDTSDSLMVYSSGAPGASQESIPTAHQLHHQRTEQCPAHRLSALSQPTRREEESGQRRSCTSHFVPSSCTAFSRATTVRDAVSQTQTVSQHRQTSTATKDFAARLLASLGTDRPATKVQQEPKTRASVEQVSRSVYRRGNGQPVQGRSHQRKKCAIA